MGLQNVFSSSRNPSDDGKAVKHLPQERPSHHQHQQSFPTGSTARLWTRRRQRLWLLFHFFWRWFITAALVACTAGVLVAYEHKSILDTSDKHIFNFLVTGLVIAIGVNFTGALSHFAEKGKWLFLSRATLPPRLFELVMGLDSQTNVIKLLWFAKGRWIMRLLCVTWLLLNIGVQILAALLGLTYQVSNPLDFGDNAVSALRGNASVVDLSFIGDISNGLTTRPGVGSPDYVNAQRSSANTFGQQTDGWGEVKASTQQFIDNPHFFANYYDEITKQLWRWQIRFVDYPVSELHYIGSSFGDNVVSTRAIGGYAECNTKIEIRNLRYGTPSTIDVTSNGRNYSIVMPEDAWNATTYISDTRPDYGARTTRVLVLWSGENATTHEFLPVLYDCNNTITHVQQLTRRGPVRDVLDLPDLQARIIAGSIGWSGIDSDATFQAHTYPASSPWSFNRYIAPWEVADLFVSRFAIGALNAMNFEGPRIQVSSLLYPNGGVALSVEWFYAGPVLGIIVAAHLILMVVAALLLNHVLIRDDGYFATAQFLKPLLNDMPAVGGGMMKSDEIAATIKHNLIYTWDERDEELNGEETKDKAGVGDVKYLKAGAVQEGEARKKFANGIYD